MEVSMFIDGYYVWSPQLRPSDYQNYVWHEFLQGPITLEKFLSQRIQECPKSRTAISFRELGWYFKSYLSGTKASHIQMLMIFYVYIKIYIKYLFVAL